MRNINYWIDKLDLLPHPEGGYYKEEYRAEETISKEVLPDRFNGNRSFSTAIYFLLPHDSFSAFHRIKQDELWHFYYGSPLIIHVISPEGVYSKIDIGVDIDNGEKPMAVVKAGCYFAAETIEGGTYTLTGCTVAPGFDFEDFEMPDAERLTESYPQHADIINRLTR